VGRIRAAGTCGPSRPATGGQAKPGLILVPVARREAFLLPLAQKGGSATPSQWLHPPDAGGGGGLMSGVACCSFPDQKPDLGPGHLERRI
jgi:hypothetical protein